MRDLGMNFLVGQTVLEAKVNPEKDIVVLNTSKGNIYLSWVGDCCAHCFLANVSGAEVLLNATILEVENAEWKVEKDEEYDVLESMGTKIKTDKGYVTLETRLTHNGYYAGEILVSDEFPLDNYFGYKDVEKLVSLEDF